MPTILAHAVAGAALASAARPSGVRAGGVIGLAAACAVLPDLDVLAFAAGIPYAHPLGHRGLSHALLVAALVGGLVAVLIYRQSPRRLALAALFAVATASHGLLDMLTDGGLGVGLWLPFDDARLFFPVRPIRVSPIGAAAISERGLATLASEALWVGVPSVMVALAGAWHRRRRRA